MNKNIISQTASLTGELFLITAMSFSLNLPSFAQVQFTDQDKQDAQDACIQTAGEKGFTWKETVTVEPDTVQTDKLKIVLNLDKEGQEYKLTCYYGADKVAVFDGGDQPAEVAETPVEQPVAQTPVATATPTPVETRSGFPWWLLLIPLIGLPLLWLLMKGNNEPTTTVATENTSTNTYREPVVHTTKEVINPRRVWIRNNDFGVNVHSGPGNTYEVTRTITEDQEVVITGRSENDWIELESGGWVERRFFEVDSNYT